MLRRRPASIVTAVRRAIVLVALTFAPANYAQDFERGQQAVELGRVALDAFERGDFASAYDGFARAEALAHSPVFVTYMARSQQKLGRWLEARALYRTVVEHDASDDDPTPWQAARKEARQELDALDARIPRLRITVTNAHAGAARVTVDAEAVPNDQLGQPIPHNPGRHSISASDGSGRTESREVVLRAGAGVLDVELDLTPPRVQPRPKQAPAKTPSPDEPRLTETPITWPGVATLAVAAVALTTGAVTGVLAKRDADAVLANCDGLSCDPADRSRADRGRALGNVSTVSFVAGGVLAAAGIFLLASPPVTKSPGGHARAAPPLSVTVGGRF